MKTQFVVSVEVPPTVSKRQMQQYIKNAVQSWKGCYHPDDPLFHIDPDEFKVFIRKPK